MIKENKNFLDEKGNFQRLKYEKFLLENNQSAPIFEEKLKTRELQKNLFDYIGAGTVSPKFLINKLYNDENTELIIDFINLKSFYKKKENLTEEDLNNFLNENKEELKVEYLDFKYAIINPKNLIETNEFNQTFFDKIDEIEIDIANGNSFENILNNFNISGIEKKNFKFSSNISDIEKKIFELRSNSFDIFEIGDDYILYNIDNINLKQPNLKDNQIKEEIIELVYQKNKFDFNRKLLEEINNKSFNNEDFLKMGKNQIQKIKLNSIRDNKKFEINSIKILYSLPENSLTLINDEKNNIYLAKVSKFVKKDKDNDQLKEYINKQNSNIKNSMLKSYDLYLNKKYDVVLNQKTIERVKNFFQ